MPQPPVFAHAASSPHLRRALQRTLPYSINLVYRTQHANQTAHAHMLATFPADADAPLPRCWAAAYFERSKRPETELWLFSTLELPRHRHASAVAGAAGQEEGECAACRDAVLALVDYMAALPTPPMRDENLPALELARQHQQEFPTPPPSGAYKMAPGTYMRHLLLPKTVTVGACHSAVLQLLQRAGMVRAELPGPDAELNKFLFNISKLPDTRELPAGLRWGEMREQDIDTVLARTSIPRTRSTLMSLKSVGVFEEETDTPVAWTFLGLDGSLVTLHTEEAYRGKGIAKAVAARILKKNAVGIARDDDGNSWSHADVYVGNAQSESVCRSLGGVALWKCFWFRIDLERAGTLASTA